MSLARRVTAMFDCLFPFPPQCMRKGYKIRVLTVFGCRTKVEAQMRLSAKCIYLIPFVQDKVCPSQMIANQIGYPTVMRFNPEMEGF